jgi:hypothetical protein
MSAEEAERGPGRGADSRGPEAAEPTEDDGWNCPICLGALNEPVVTRCGHVFCWSCLCEWLRGSNRCPTCGGVTDRSALISVTGQGPVADLSDGGLGTGCGRLKLGRAGLDVDLARVLRPTGENIWLWISVLFFIIVVCV